jgi:aspartyl-tRNA(Asn)/glutamyl-tRNA(Gln) amidotransferase subunit B
MNSLRSLGRALEYEIERQTELLDRGERIAQETRHWNEDEGQTHSLRSKEEAFDYRYFPEPDLVPLAPDAELHERARAAIPELPAARRARVVADWGINEDDARTLVSSPGLADYSEAAAAALKAGTPADVARWCTGSVLAHVHESGLSVEVLPLAPDGLAELVDLVADGTLSRKLAQDVLAECMQEPKRPKQVVAERGLSQVSDEGELAALVDGLIAKHPTEAETYRSGDEKARKKIGNFFTGRAMAATKGQANPKVLTKLLESKLQ